MIEGGIPYIFSFLTLSPLQDVTYHVLFPLLYEKGSHQDGTSVCIQAGGRTYCALQVAMVHHVESQVREFHGQCRPWLNS
jgi:hypothetical protein